MIEARTAAGGEEDSLLAAGVAGGLMQEAANEARPERNAAPGGRTPGLRNLPVFHLLVLLFVYGAWKFNSHLYITPEQGAGYALGITGGAMLLLLMLYPLRKHARWARGLGPVRYWFRGHMLLGVLGPVCILLHCNFQVGSINGSVALYSMLLVAGSGLVGRYLYTRIHHGLYGRRADLAGLGSDTALARAELETVFANMPGLQERLRRLEQTALAARSGFLSSLLGLLVVSMRSRWCLAVSLLALRRFFNAAAVRGKLTRAQRRHYLRKTGFHLRAYLYAVRRVAGFTFFERLFSMWHVLHLPLFVMLLIAGMVHVCAVHVY